MSTIKKGTSYDPRYSVYIHDNIMFRTGADNSNGLPATKHTAPVNLETKITEGLIPWGSNNLYPQTIIKEIADSPIIQRGLNWQAQALYGGGLMVGEVVDYNNDGSEVFIPKKFPEWEEFKKKVNILQYLMNACLDFYYFGVPFPEFVLTKGSSLAPKRIYSIKAQKAKNCRFASTKNNGIIDHCYMSGEWNSSLQPEVKVDVIDPFDSTIEKIKQTNASKVILPMAYPTPGEDIYPLLPWNAIRKYWLPISKLIPEIKYNMMNTGAHPLLLVEIADWYWESEFFDWHEQPDLQKKRMEEKFTMFANMISGSANAGKTLFVPARHNPETMEAFPGWKITPIDRGFGEGKWIDDSTECSLQLMIALGLDPSLIGIVPGKTMSTHGGSDKRVAFNTYISMRQMDRDIILHPLYIIKQVNAFSESMEFRFKYPLITTLDKGKESQQQTS